MRYWQIALVLVCTVTVVWITHREFRRLKTEIIEELLSRHEDNGRAVFWLLSERKRLETLDVFVLEAKREEYRREKRRQERGEK